MEASNTILFFMIMFSFIVVCTTFAYALALNYYSRKIVRKLDDIAAHTNTVTKEINQYTQRKDEILK